MVSQTSLVFNSPLGGATQSQPINVTSNGAALSYSISFTSTRNFMYADQSGGTTPGIFNVFVTTTNLEVGTYSGSVTITPLGGGTPVSLPVTLNIGAATALTASQGNLSFTAQSGGASPAAQPLTITSATNGVTFSASVSTSSGGSWLAVAPNGGVTPTTLQVSVNSTGLAIGSYSGTINLSASGTGPLSIPVSLTVTGQPVLTVSQSNIQFFYQLGQAGPVQQNLTVSSGGVPVAFTAVPSTSSCGVNWLVVTPQSGSTPANLSVGASVAAFTQPGTCAGTILVSAPGAMNSPQTVNVSLTVSFNPFLISTPSSISFAYQAGGPSPTPQTIVLSSSSTPLPYTVALGSTATWLSAGPLSGTTSPSGQITLSANPAGLNPGTYNTTVIVTAAGAQNSPVTIPVTLTVSASSLLTATPPFANFNFQIGQAAPNPLNILLGSTGAALPFVVTTPVTTGFQFLTVTPTTGATPASLTLTANPGSLAPGVYSTSVAVTPASGTTNPQNIPVTLTVSATPLANVSPSSLTFNYALNTAFPPAQTLAISSTGAPVTFTAASGAAWLVVSPSGNGVTPANLTVGVAPYNLAIGSYSTSVIVTAGGYSQNVAVTLNITSGVTLSSTPASLSFTQVMNGAAPAAMSVSIQATGGSGAIAFSTSAATLSGQSWLSVTPSTGSAPGTIMVSVNGAALSPGTYSGTVSVLAAGSANLNGVLSIPVTLVITAPPALTVSPVGLNFTSNAGGPSPAAQTLQITSSSSTAVQFTAAVATGGFLTVSSSTLTTPAALIVNANTAGLAQGTYNGSITLTPTGGGSPISVPVVLTINAAVIPTFAQIGNAASYASGGVAPGELVSFFGTGLGPVVPLGLTFTPSGTVSTNLGGVTVTFNGIAAPLTYVSASQINCVAPFELAGSASAQVVISYNGVVSVPQTIGVVATAPGMFTQNSSGSGPASILKADYSTVTAANPAPRGSTVILYLTGGGQTTPASVTGTIAGSALLTTSAKVSVTIGGIPATVAYAGSAPTLVNGVLQVNVVVPSTAGTGAQPIVVTVGSASSQAAATIAVQ